MLMFVVLNDLDAVSAMKNSSLNNTAQNAFLGHDTVPGLIEDGTPLMAFLSDLGDLHEDAFPQSETGSDRNRLPIDSFRGDIFCKIAERNVKACLSGLLDAFRSEEADLSMPGACMRIPLDPMIRDHNDSIHNLFSNPLFPAHSKGYNPHGHLFYQGFFLASYHKKDADSNFFLTISP